MPTSKRPRPGQRTVMAMLLLANVLLYLAWLWLPADSRLGISPEDFVLAGEPSHAWLFDTIRRQERILVLGTSESDNDYNLAYQLNELTPHDPQMILVARAGTSPIHSSLIFARGKEKGVAIPPLVLVVNLVYFTRSHDVINDGWMTKVIPSPVFYLVNHGGIRSHLSEEVRRAYGHHFALRRLLYPMTVQEYLGNLMYLRARHPFDGSMLASYVQPYEHRFKGALPRYDEQRAVWAGYGASDETMKSRWEVSRAEDSLNLKGLASTLSILRQADVPVLVLILPMNRTFYRYYGLDMAEYDRRYAAIRARIRSLAESRTIAVVDLYETPRLHLGFRDRMHPDEYGFFQLARYLVDSDAYRRFIVAVRQYYGRSAPGRAVATTQDRQKIDNSSTNR